MYRQTTILSLLIVLINYHVFGQQETESEGKILKVMSYNIHIANPPSTEWGTVDIDAIADVIKSANPDLVALQEVDKFTERSGKNLNQAKEIATKTDMEYYFIKALDRSGGDYGLAILSKFPIQEKYSYSLPGIEGSDSELRALGVVELEIDGEKFFFAVTHLDHLLDESREHQAKKMLASLEEFDDSPIILGGDFNTTPDNDLWGLINSFFEIGCEECPLTFPSDKPERTIDYLLLNNKAKTLFEVKNYNAIPEEYPSDHLPIVMDLIRESK